MAYEDFTTFTEVDEDNDITVSQNQITVDTMRRDARSYVYKDYGAGYFGDFTHGVDIDYTYDDWGGMVVIWGVVESSLTIEDMWTNNDGLMVYVGSNSTDSTYRLVLYDNTNDNSDYHAWTSPPGQLYLTIERSGTSLTCKIYTDAARTNLLDTLSVTCTSTAYRILVATGSRNSTVVPDAQTSVVVENLDIAAPYEDFSIFTEVDPNSDISVYEHLVSIDTIRRDAISYVYKDYGANYFGNFEHKFEATFSAASGDAATCGLWALSNTIGTLKDREDAGDGISVFFYYHSGMSPTDQVIVIRRASDGYQELYYISSLPATFYFTVSRNGSTVNLYIYSDAERTNLLDTLTITEDTAYRYLYATFSKDDPNSNPASTASAEISNLDICASYEDFTTFTEVDPNSDITVALHQIAVDTMRRDARSYVFKDYSPAQFGDFVHNIDINWTGSVGDQPRMSVWGLTNSSYTEKESDTNNEGIVVGIRRTLAGSYYLYVKDHSNDNEDGHAYTSLPVERYLTIERSDTTITVKIYIDSARTNLEDTLTIACDSTAFNLLFATMSYEDVNYPSDTITVDVSNLNINDSAVEPPSEPPSDGDISIPTLEWHSDVVTTYATCWKITRRDGTVMGFTDLDRNIVYDGVTYKAVTGYSASAIKTPSDFSVPNMDLLCLLDDDEIALADLEAGVYDYAEVHIFMIDYENPSQGIFKLRRGWLGEVKAGDYAFTAELRGMTQVLQQEIGHVYTPHCNVEALGDSRCKVVIEPNDWQASTAYTVREDHDDGSGSIVKPTAGGILWAKCIVAGTSGSTEPTWGTSVGETVVDGTVTWEMIRARQVSGVITEVDDNRNFYDSSRSEPDGYFNGGKIVFTSGSNLGYEMEIKDFVSSTGKFELYLAMPKTVSIDDTYKAYVGCDRLKSTCKTKFDNLYNFRGFPHIPGTDEMLSTPNAP